MTSYKPRNIKNQGKENKRQRRKKQSIVGSSRRKATQNTKHHPPRRRRPWGRSAHKSRPSLIIYCIINSFVLLGFSSEERKPLFYEIELTGKIYIYIHRAVLEFRLLGTLKVFCFLSLLLLSLHDTDTTGLPSLERKQCKPFPYLTLLFLFLGFGLGDGYFSHFSSPLWKLLTFLDWFSFGML